MLVVVIGVPTLLAALFYYEVTGLSGPGHGPTPIGAAFSAGNPVSGECSTTMAANMACAAPGDFVYNITVEASAVTLNSVEFEVEGPTGAFFHPTGPAEFSLVTYYGVTAAYAPISAGASLAMTSTWSDYGAGYTGSSALTSDLLIIIDVGQSEPTTGQGLVFFAIGVGAYSGTTALLSLP